MFRRIRSSPTAVRLTACTACRLSLYFLRMVMTIGRFVASVLWVSRPSALPAASSQVFGAYWCSLSQRAFPSSGILLASLAGALCIAFFARVDSDFHVSCPLGRLLTLLECTSAQVVLDFSLDFSCYSIMLCTTDRAFLCR